MVSSSVSGVGFSTSSGRGAEAHRKQQQAAQAERERERRRAEEDVVRLRRAGIERGKQSHDRHHVAVEVHRPLRLAGRARGESDEATSSAACRHVGEARGCLRERASRGRRARRRRRSSSTCFERRALRPRAPPARRCSRASQSACETSAFVDDVGQLLRAQQRHRGDARRRRPSSRRTSTPPSSGCWARAAARGCRARAPRSSHQHVAMRFDLRRAARVYVHSPSGRAQRDALARAARRPARRAARRRS